MESRIRRASTLALVPEGRRLVVYNFLSARCLPLTPARQALLLGLDRWTARRSALACVPPPVQRARVELERLIEHEFVLTEGSAQAEVDRRYERDWDWDIRAGLFHLAIKDPPVLDEGQDQAELEARVLTKPQVPLHRDNREAPERIELRRPSLERGLFRTLARRRSRRQFTARPLSERQVSECLFAGLGVVGFMRDALEGMQPLPLKLTPSGGARNPYEAYLYARRVEGLPPGLYHYSAVEHSLGRVECASLPAPHEFIGGQTWGDDAAALVFLVANFERTMWKYAHPMVYRAVLVEAGHIAQNLMVVAASHGLSTVPTALLNDALFDATLGLDRIMQSAVYVIGIGHPRTNKLDWGRFVSVSTGGLPSKEVR